MAEALGMDVLDAMKELLEESLAFSFGQWAVFDYEIKQTATRGHLLGNVGNILSAPVICVKCATLAGPVILDNIFMPTC